MPGMCSILRVKHLDLVFEAYAHDELLVHGGVALGDFVQFLMEELDVFLVMLEVVVPVFE